MIQLSSWYFSEFFKKSTKSYIASTVDIHELHCIDRSINEIVKRKQITLKNMGFCIKCYCRQMTVYYRAVTSINKGSGLFNIIIYAVAS